MQKAAERATLLDRAWLDTRSRAVRAVWPFAVLLVCTSIPFVTGVAWLAVLFGFERAVAVGLAPLLIGAAVKLVLTCAMVREAESAARR